ncbi:MAG: FecR family protein [Spirochaetota bacterium]
MKTITIKTTLLTFLALAALADIHAKTVAKFESIAGLVQYREKGGKWQNAKIGTPLTANTELQTSPTGKATLLFPNGTKVTLKPGTLAALDQYTAGSYGTQTNMSLRVGRMNADIAKVNDANVRNHFRVRTPTVVAGVRGSNTDISNGMSTNIRMNEHSMDVNNRFGQQIRVPQGGGTQITGNQMMRPDQLESRDNTVTMTAQEAATMNESEMAMFAGDFLFSNNPDDFADFMEFVDFLNFLDFLNGSVTFEKL